MYVKISKSERKDKKYTAKFYDDDQSLVKTTHFGQKGAGDFTKHGNEVEKKLYLARHKKNENWNDYKTPASLARHILWNKPTLQASINDYVKRFNLKIKSFL
jgi:hypothetical protein